MMVNENSQTALKELDTLHSVIRASTLFNNPTTGCEGTIDLLAE